MSDKTKLLLVDDEDTIRTLVRHELETHGFAVEEAESGAAALEKLGGSAFDLVVLDIRMPEMDGLEVLKNIRANNLAPKVIMLTGVDELKIARDSLALGASDFMTKPFDFKNLLTCINRVLKE
jgi:two-component system alkaline phosphatase synthesis response regulator PhoP